VNTHGYEMVSALASTAWRTRGSGGDALAEIAASHQKRLVDLAIAWVLRQPALRGAIMGIRNAQEARTMAGGIGWQLTEEERDTIEQALEPLGTLNQEDLGAPS
jgi:aryl-alcohol dehydrogenase-like predicted oxidoreductase